MKEFAITAEIRDLAMAYICHDAEYWRQAAWSPAGFRTVAAGEAKRDALVEAIGRHPALAGKGRAEWEAEAFKVVQAIEGALENGELRCP